MLFRRKKPASWPQRVRQFVWPRKGALRGFRYLGLRIVRLSSSPHSIAVGVAAGAASSATPFIGFHILLALAVAYVLSGNLIAAGIATALANPLTIPFILVATYEIGVMMMGVGEAQALSGQQMLHMLTHLEISQLWKPLLQPMILGSLPLSAVCATVFYVGALFAARLFQARRRARYADRLRVRSLAVVGQS